MNRRGFLGRLGLLPLAAKGFWSGHKQVLIQPSTPLAKTQDRFYQYIRAANHLERGTPVYVDDRIVGFAMSRIDRGNYGFIQVANL